MMFSKKPFVFILPLLVIGILLFDEMINSWLISLVGLSGSLLLYGLFSIKAFKRLEKIKVVCLSSAIVFLGGFIISTSRGESITIGKEASLIVHVDEIASSDKEWRKSICSIESIFTKDSIINHQEKVLLFFNDSNIKSGDVLLVQTDMEPILNKNNPGEFDVQSYWNNKNIFQIGFVFEDDFKFIETIQKSWLNQFLINIRNRLKNQLKLVLQGEELGVATALLLGDKELLASETRSNFSNAGAMHVLAVSGLHVGIVLFILMFLLGKISRFISKKNAVIISIVIIWFYAGITGFSPSVMRASFMFSLIAIAQIRGKSSNAINTLMFSAFALLVFNPLWIYDIGFQLSYLAMLGIFLLYKPISQMIYLRNKWLMKIWQGTAVGLAAQAFTVPLTLYYFHQFPNYFILTNIGMMVFAGLILGIGLFFFSVSWVSIFKVLVGKILEIGLFAMLLFIQFIDQIPFSVATGFTLSKELLVVVYFLMLLLIINQFKKIKIVVLLSLFFVFIKVQHDRYQNLNKSELVIFNSDDFTMSIKNKNQIICLHSAKQEREKRIEMLMDQYVSVSPGTYQILVLKEGNTSINIGGDQFDLFVDKYGVRVQNKKVDLYVRTNYSGNFFELKNSYDMAYLAKNEDRYNLSSGAKVIPL